MFQRLFRLFKPTQMGYTPVRHSFFRDEHIADRLHKEGYCVVDFIDKQQQEALLDLYEKHHQLSVENPGVFFGSFSKNKKYTKEIHNEAVKILLPSFIMWFKNFKCVINNFVVKTPGEVTTVPIHQDGAALDELKYSSINVWIPLQSVNSQNGALSIVPRSHNIFYPYRCNTIPPLTKDIEMYLYPYFVSLEVNAGQAVLFDSRLFHYSKPNLSEENRVTMVSRITPVDAQVMAYYQEGKEGAPVEAYLCPDDYLVTSVSYNDTERPVGVKLVKCLDSKIKFLTQEEFKRNCAMYGIEIQDPHFNQGQYHSTFIEEPNR